jgi:hypothetical protein
MLFEHSDEGGMANYGLWPGRIKSDPPQKSARFEHRAILGELHK